MAKMSSVKTATVCGICIALCYVLPMAFHALGLGSVFSPMHIPVLLCGLLCGPFYGGFCGLAGPVLSSVLSGMPSPTGLITMVPELLAYGIITGLLARRIRTGRLVWDLYLSLVPAMVLGRVVGGIAQALFVRYLTTSQVFTLSLWATSYFVVSLPGIVVHLILIPLLVLTLTRAKVIPSPYLKQA